MLISNSSEIRSVYKKVNLAAVGPGSSAPGAGFGADLRHALERRGARGAVTVRAGRARAPQGRSAGTDWARTAAGQGQPAWLAAERVRCPVVPEPNAAGPPGPVPACTCPWSRETLNAGPRSGTYAGRWRGHRRPTLLGSE